MKDARRGFVRALSDGLDGVFNNNDGEVFYENGVSQKRACVVNAPGGVIFGE